MKKNFKMVAGWVMSVLGIQNFAKNEDGKLFLTDVQKKLLADKYGQVFVDSFTADLDRMEVEGNEVNLTLSAEEKLELEAGRMETARLRQRIEQLEAEKKTFQATIDKLEHQPAGADGEQVKVSDFEQQLRQNGVDLSLRHNRFLADYMQGRIGAAYSGDSTINTQELKKEFGKYVSSERLEILRGLFGQTTSTQCMSTIITDKTEVRANQASIVGTVLQQFVPEWTPSGAAKFTPLRIKNFKHKLNVPIKPSDIMEDIIGYMYDEQAKTLQSMPVVRYILWHLIFPKLDEEREQALAIGRYKEVQPDGEGKYTASSPNESMDGYLTQLVDLYNANNTAVRWLKKGEAIGNEAGATRKFIDAAVKEVADKWPLYAAKAMKVHIDPVLADTYRREYLEEYKWLKNQDGTHKNDIDFSRFTFAELEGLRGTGCFFITPKENFKHLMSHNPQNVTLRFLENHYSVDIMAEWWEGTGFWLAEALFPYIAPAAAETYKAPAESNGDGAESSGDGA